MNEIPERTIEDLIAASPAENPPERRVEKVITDNAAEKIKIVHEENIFALVKDNKIARVISVTTLNRREALELAAFLVMETAPHQIEHAWARELTCAICGHSGKDTMRKFLPRQGNFQTVCINEIACQDRVIHQTGK